MAVTRKIQSGLRRYPGAIARSLGHLVHLPVPRPAIKVVRESYWGDHALWRRHTFAASWMGHATVLLRLGGLTMLTDPVWSERIGIRVGGRTIGPERLIHLPGRIESLPPVDIILLTHAHFDHLDRPTLARLVSPRTTVLTASCTTGLVPSGFRGVRELTSGEVAHLDGDVHVTALQPEHWGARTVWDRHRGCNAYLIEHRNHRVLFAGDTAYTRAFDGLGPVDLAIMGIGAYRPWSSAHANPEQVWQMASRMGARRLMPIHHSTFELSDEPINEPLEWLLRVAHPRRVVGQRIGEVYTAA